MYPTATACTLPTDRDTRPAHNALRTRPCALSTTMRTQDNDATGGPCSEVHTRYETATARAGGGSLVPRVYLTARASRRVVILGPHCRGEGAGSSPERVVRGPGVAVSGKRACGGSRVHTLLHGSAIASWSS